MKQSHQNRMKSTSYATQNQITVIQPSKPEGGEQVINDYDYPAVKI